MSVSDDDLPPGVIRSRPRSQDSSPFTPRAPIPGTRPDSALLAETADRPARSAKAERSHRVDDPRPDSDPDMHFDPIGKAREDAYFFLSYSDRSEKELIDRLRKRKHSDEIIDEVLAHLRAEGYLNDANFARRLVESRGKTRGARALSFELRQKGIDGELALEALAERGDETERASAWLAATRRVGNPPVADQSPAAAKRLSAFLQRRGFAYATVRSVLRELFAVHGEAAGEAEEFMG